MLSDSSPVSYGLFFAISFLSSYIHDGYYATMSLSQANNLRSSTYSPIWKWSVHRWLKSVWKRRLQASRQQENSASGESSPWGQGERQPGVRIITLIALPLLWIGVLPLPFTGSEGNSVQLFPRDTHVLAVERGRADQRRSCLTMVLDVLARRPTACCCSSWAAATIVHVASEVAIPQPEDETTYPALHLIPHLSLAARSSETPPVRKRVLHEGTAGMPRALVPHEPKRQRAFRASSDCLSTAARRPAHRKAYPHAAARSELLAEHLRHAVRLHGHAEQHIGHSMVVRRWRDHDELRGIREACRGTS